MISVENVTKRYASKTAVDGLSFEVEKGEILGFLGPNGAGKTSTMRIVTGFMPASEGTVRVDGYDVFEKPLEVRRRIGYLPENPPLYTEMTAIGYLRFVAKLKGVKSGGVDDEVDRVIGKVHIEEVRDRTISKLSKGYKQRVGLAQALLNDPPILILDEPTVGLDPNQIREVRELIKGLASNHTIVLSTHILPEVEQTCSRALIINRGRIAADMRLQGAGTAENVVLEIEGPTAEVLDGLRKVSKVVEVRMTSGTPGLGRFQVRSESGIDLRRELARAVLDSGWGLMEMRASMGLEDLFMKVTTEDVPATEAADTTENGIPGPAES